MRVEIASQREALRPGTLYVPPSGSHMMIETDCRLSIARNEPIEHVRPNADMLYQLLWGFTPAQLESGAAAELVSALEHRDMAVRVFAAQSLQSITHATAGYRPDYHLNRRRDAIQVWRRKLDEGAIRYPVEPENDLAW